MLNTKINKKQQVTSELFYFYPKKTGGVYLTPCRFCKTVCSRERLESCVFITFNIIIICIFHENFIKVMKKNFSEDMKTFSVNINYFDQFFVFF